MSDNAEKQNRDAGIPASVGAFWPEDMWYKIFYIKVFQETQDILVTSYKFHVHLSYLLHVQISCLCAYLMPVYFCPLKFRFLGFFINNYFIKIFLLMAFFYCSGAVKSIQLLAKNAVVRITKF